MNNGTDPYIWRPDANFAELSYLTAEKEQSLRGLRLAVKDLFHIKNVPTTAGNPDWLKSHPMPKQTSSVVETLISHGAQLTGKTITDELAYSLNGQNMHYGTPINVKAPDRLPGGSTSGSATAVAEGSADIGLGTDTGGSIRVPASYNGLFGLRPTHGVVSVDSLVGLAPGFDTVGWLTRDLDTLNKVAAILVSECTTQLDGTAAYIEEINEKASHKHDLLSFITSIKSLTITTSKLPPEFLDNASGAFRTLQGRQIWRLHGDWIKQHNPVFAADITERFNWCETLTDDDEKRALQMADEINEGINALLKTFGVLIIPTTPGPAPLLSMPADTLAEYRVNLMSMTAIAGLGGLPQLHIPLDTQDQLPVGVSLIGKKYSDLALIKFAADLMAESSCNGDKK